MTAAALRRALAERDSYRLLLQAALDKLHEAHLRERKHVARADADHALRRLNVTMTVWLMRQMARVQDERACWQRCAERLMSDE